MLIKMLNAQQLSTEIERMKRKWSVGPRHFYRTFLLSKEMKRLTE